eukprot:Skav223841  [mRNA]  locus=scaffold2304:92787:107917:+ [translate_table: standard]
MFWVVQHKSTENLCRLTSHNDGRIVHTPSHDLVKAKQHGLCSGLRTFHAEKSWGHLPEFASVLREPSKIRPSKSKVTCRTQDDSSRKRMSTVSSTGLSVRTEMSMSTSSLSARMAVLRKEACGEFACMMMQSKAALRNKSSSDDRSCRYTL